MKLLLPICLLMVVGISGCTADCTIPGTSITLPFCGSGLNQADDVLIIKEVRAIPTTVTVPQSLRVIASIENRGDKAFKYSSGSTTPVTGGDLNEVNPNTVTVELFDFCTGLFAIKQTVCPEGNEGGNQRRCEINDLLPGEIKEVSWVLQPSDATKLITKCTLKVSATYPYTTDGLTTVHFINSQEYLRQVAEGTFKTRTSTTSRGLGPVKAWFEIKDQQPIIAAPNTVGGNPTTAGFVPASLVIENRGSGIVRSQDAEKNPSVKLESTNVFSDFGAVDAGCSVPRPTNAIRLVQDKRTLPCSIQQLYDTAVPKETTRQLNVQISYLYETRSELQVTVEPQFNPTK